MTWESDVHIDEDKVDVGTVTVIWTDPNTALGVFPYSERIQANAAGRDAFNQRAIAARDRWQVDQQTNINYAANVLSFLNAADPKVT